MDRICHRCQQPYIHTHDCQAKSNWPVVLFWVLVALFVILPAMQWADGKSICEVGTVCQ